MSIHDLDTWVSEANRFINSLDAQEWYTQYLEVDELKGPMESMDYLKVLKGLNHIWWRLPDVPEIHRLPLFHLMCDLCSESYVLQEGSDVRP